MSKPTRTTKTASSAGDPERLSKEAGSTTCTGARIDEIQIPLSSSSTLHYSSKVVHVAFDFTTWF